MRSVSVSEFKAKCLELLDEVNRTGEPVEILQEGRPVAQVMPPPPLRGASYPQESLRGTVKYFGDILEPIFPPEVWEAERKR
jgi:prevent-host-death family protein